MNVNVFLCILFCVTSLLLSGLDFQMTSLGLFAVSSFFFLLAIEEKNLFHMMWGASFFVFTITPVIILFFLNYDINMYIPNMCVLFSSLVIVLTKGLNYKAREVNKEPHFFNGFPVLFILFFTTIAFSGEYFIYFIGLGAYGFVKVAINNKFQSLINYSAIYFSIVLFYYFFYWGGFGRLLIVGYILPFILILSYEFRFVIPKFLLFPTLSLGAVFAVFIRYPNASGNQILTYVVRDSMMAPYFMLESIIDKVGNNQYANIMNLLEQFGLIFTFFIPRTLWSEKPYGFGFLYTIQHDSQALIDAGHSYAGYFLAEHIYFAENLFFLTVIVTLLFVTLSYKFVLSLLGEPFAVIFCMYIMTFYWGGLTAFTQRLSMSFLLLFICIFLFNFLIRIAGKKQE